MWDVRQPEKNRCNSLLNIRRQKEKYSRNNFSGLCVPHIYLCHKTVSVFVFYTTQEHVIYLFFFFILNNFLGEYCTYCHPDQWSSLVGYVRTVNYSSILMCTCVPLPALVSVTTMGTLQRSGLAYVVKHNNNRTLTGLNLFINVTCRILPPACTF